MKTVSIILLSTLYSICLQAADIQGVVTDSSNTPIVGVNITMRTLEGTQVMEGTQSLSDGTFILKGVNPGNYTLVCTHIGYADYIAEVQVNKEASLSLGTLIMSPQSVQLKEVTVSIRRNVFTADKQAIYPSKQQTETSGGGLDYYKNSPFHYWILILLIAP